MKICVARTFLVERHLDVVLVVLIVVGSKDAEGFCGHLLNGDDHSHWAPPYWNIKTETFFFGYNGTLNLIAKIVN